MNGGYIIAKGNDFLTKGLFWAHAVAGSRPAHIFTFEQTVQIITNTPLWKEKPTHVFRATVRNGQVELSEMITVVNFADTVR